MLWGLAGLSLPVIAHLLRRGVSEKFFFPAVWLLVQSRKDASAGLRLWRYLLLLLRILAIVLLVLAFARPQTVNPNGLQAGSVNTANPLPGGVTLVLLDGSRSMGQVVDGVEVWSQALVAAERVIQQLRAGKDRVQVWRVGGRVEKLLPMATADLALARQRLSLQADRVPVGGDGSLERAVVKALGYLEEAGGGRLVVVTDGLLEVEAAARVPVGVRVVSLVEAAGENVGLVSVRARDEDAVAGARGGVMVEVGCFAETDWRGAVRVRVDGVESVVPVSVVAGGVTSIEVPVPWSQAGWRDVYAELTELGGQPVVDALASDNVRRAGAWVRGVVPVGVSVGAGVDRGELAMVMAALSPFRDGRDRFDAQLRLTANTGSLPGAGVVVWVGGQRLSGQWVDWVRQGGRLVWMPAVEADTVTRISMLQPEGSPLVEGMSQEALGAMARSLSPGQPGAWAESLSDSGGKSVWLQNDALRPLVVHEALGQGGVVRMGLPLSQAGRTGWLVPLLQQAVADLLPVEGGLIEGVVGQPAAMMAVTDAGGVDSQWAVMGPEGEAVSAQVRRVRGGVSAAVVPEREGLYRLQMVDEALASGGAVLVSGGGVAESDLIGGEREMIRWESERVQQGGGGYASSSSGLSLDALGEPGVIEWWPVCLALAGGVMFVELMLAGKAVA